MNDPIDPEHYKQGGIQPKDYIEANDMDFYQGNVVKYVSRHKYKNGLQDLLKAQRYLGWMIERYDQPEGE